MSTIVIKTTYADDIRRVALPPSEVEEAQSVVNWLRKLYGLPAPFWRNFHLAVSGTFLSSSSLLLLLLLLLSCR